MNNILSKSPCNFSEAMVWPEIRLGLRTRKEQEQIVNMSDDESSESDSFYDAEDTEDTICNSSTR